MSSFDDDARLLDWVADRLIHTYGQSENVDYVRGLRRIADNQRLLGSMQGDINRASESMAAFASAFNAKCRG